MIYFFNQLTRTSRRSTIASVIFGFVFWLGLPAVAISETHQYEIDQNHTIIRFVWNHNGLANMSGRFLTFEGDLNLDFETPSNSQVRVRIDPASIWTGVEALDDDMRSARLFNVEAFPEIVFESLVVRQTGLQRGQLSGSLTIKGITRPVTLEIEVNRNGRHHFADTVEEYADALSAGLSIHARVNRSDFGLGMAVPWIADEIDIFIETELVAYPANEASE